jgi:MbtH protein
MPNGTTEATYRVVVNHEGQYSVLAVDGELPAGWRDAGHAGSRDACLAHIEAVWTDMGPLGLRTAEQGSRIRVPGAIVALPKGAEEADTAGAGLGEMISRERRRHAETRAASEPLTDAAGARVCCVMCFNRHNAEPDAG